VLTRLVALRGVPNDVDEGVRSRLRRQVALYDSEKHFRFLLSEAALRSPPCPLVTQLAQLDRLVALAGLDTLDLAVLPLTTELPVFTYGACWIYDAALVLVETLTAEFEGVGRRCGTRYAVPQELADRLALCVMRSGRPGALRDRQGQCSAIPTKRYSIILSLSFLTTAGALSNFCARPMSCCRSSPHRPSSPR
jgi:hypothetical protein